MRRPRGGGLPTVQLEVDRCWREANAAGLAPGVSGLEVTGRLLADEAEQEGVVVVDTVDHLLADGRPKRIRVGTIRRPVILPHLTGDDETHRIGHGQRHEGAHDPAGQTQGAHQREGDDEIDSEREEERQRQQDPGDGEVGWRAGGVTDPGQEGLSLPAPEGGAQHRQTSSSRNSCPDNCGPGV